MNIPPHHELTPPTMDAIDNLGWSGTIQEIAEGLLLATENFTRKATKEATRDGASPIDLIDGDALIEMLKQLRLGVHVRMVEDTLKKVLSNS
jgi:restriction endonuclease Mrr